MTTNTTNNQAASIDTPEFRALMKELIASSISRQIDVSREVMGRIISGIDAKLVQEWLNGFSSGAEAADIIQEKTNYELVKMEARTIAAESRLAEIQPMVKELEAHHLECENIFSVLAPRKILAILAPQGQTNTSGLPG